MHTFIYANISIYVYTYIHINLVVQVAADDDDIFNKADMLGEGPARDETRPRSNSNHILLGR